MKQSICCTNMYDDTMVLLINSFYNGFTELFGYKEGQSTLYRMSLTKDKVAIKNLSEGYYTFYTQNPNTSVTTSLMTFYFKTELPSYVVNRLWSSANIEATTYTSTLKINLMLDLERSRSSSLLSLIYKRYQAIDNIEEFEEDIFYKLMLCQETYENLQSSNRNRDGVGFARLTALPSPKLVIPSSVEVIKVYDISDGNKRLCEVYRPTDNTITIPLMIGLFEIHLLQDGYLLSVLKHCNLSDKSMIRMWDDYQSNNMDYLDVVENNLASSIDLTTFTDKEVIKYKEEVGMNPMNAIIPRIKVAEEKYIRSVDLTISGVSFANVSRHTFFVSGRDVDFLTENVQNEFIPLIAETDVFTSKFEPATCMLDNEALLYIIDERGTIVSRTTRCLLDEDSTTSLSNYYEKVRQAEISSYGRRFLAQVLSSYPAGWSYSQEMIDRCLEDENVTVDNILVQLLSDVYNAPLEVDKDLLSVEIIKDFISSSNYNLNFFNEGGFVWKPLTHTVVGEPSETGYVLCILAHLEGKTRYSTYYTHSFPDQTVEVLLNRYGSYVLYAISESDYSYSGFIYLNTHNGFVKSYLVGLEVK